MANVILEVSCLRVSATILTTIAIATAGIGIPAFANSAMNQPVNLAQGSLVGQCRAVNKQVSVFKQAAATSPIVSTLKVNTQVTLADNGSGGFIGISSPVSGYLQTANLKPCSTPPKPPGNTCRRVIQPLGLTIRREASPESQAIGGVAYQEQVFLTTTPATARLGPDGRNWIQIARPAAGWVSNGFKDGNSNLGLCP